MQFLKYIGLLFNRAAQKSVLLTDRLTILIVPFTTLVLWLAGAKMTDSVQETLLLGVAITVVAVVLFRLAAASYWLWTEDRDKIQQLQAELASPQSKEAAGLWEHRLILRKELGECFGWLITFAEYAVANAGHPDKMNQIYKTEQGYMGANRIEPTYSVDNMLRRVSNDAGLPIYQKLSAGPQIRKARAKRPLQDGGTADIYQAILLALAATGPKSVVPYEELRQELNSLLREQVPQKHEITSALKHLATLAREFGKGAAIDWNEDTREVNLVDPYLRFYLRWQVRKQPDAEPKA